jgi:hypothetical protein
MQDPFSIEGFIEILAKRVAVHLRAELGQDGATTIKPRLLTVEQASTYLGRTEEALQHMIAGGKVPTVRLDRRVFIDVRDLERLIDRSKS